jgi:hypothetical protein
MTPATVPVVMALEGTGVRRVMPSQEEVLRVCIKGMVVEDFMQTEEEEDSMEVVVMHHKDGVIMAPIGSLMSGGSKVCLSQSLTRKEAWGTQRCRNIK